MKTERFTFIGMCLRCLKMVGSSLNCRTELVSRCSHMVLGYNGKTKCDILKLLWPSHVAQETVFAAKLGSEYRSISGSEHQLHKAPFGTTITDTIYRELHFQQYLTCP